MTNNQKGFTLLEIYIGIGLALILSLYLANLTTESSRNIKEQNVAQHMKQINRAAIAYIKDNQATIAATATPTTPHVLQVATLTANGYLPAGFNAINAYNQTACILTLEPVANRLETIVVTEGGTPISSGRIGTIANLIGSNGGFILANNTTAQGSFGSWTRNIAPFITGNCSGTAANADHLASALFLDSGDISNDYLYRSAVPGRPELNTVTTPIILDTVRAVGSACTVNGAVANSSTGSVLSCQSGTFRPQGSAFWEDPVLNFASLPVCNAASAFQTRIVRTPTTGTGARAYTCNGAGAWNALGVNDAGNLVLPGTATVGKVQINDVVTENAGCTPNGLIARDSVGLILSCQGSIWKKASGSNNGFYNSSSGGYRYSTGCSNQGGSASCLKTNPRTGACSCPSGSSAIIVSVVANGCIAAGTGNTSTYTCE